MSDESLNKSLTIEHLSNSFRKFVKKPTIKILLYTDYGDHMSISRFDILGLGLLHDLLMSHTPLFADLSIDYKSRFPTEDDGGDEADLCTAKEKVNAFINDYHEMWMFGYYQKKIGFCHPIFGGPENELDDNEVIALGQWMNGKRGGVLMTGDHTQLAPGDDQSQDACAGSDHQTFLGLGRALGHRVPRAGKMRQWDGPPTNCKDDSHNTQEPGNGNDLENKNLQRDEFPQKLDLKHYPPLGLPHSLFLGRRQSIRVFPDHKHEGEIIIPSSLADPDEWPLKAAGGPIEPELVAYGRDKRPVHNGAPYPIVSVYDGDGAVRQGQHAPVGRIVADSTWHHFVNINLVGFMDPSEDSVSDLLGQYYSNLAIWLAPLEIRKDMARTMFWWLVNHPELTEEIGTEALNLGQIARQELSKTATLCEIHELLAVSCPMSLRPPDERLFFPSLENEASWIPPQEMILGCVLKEFHRALSAIVRGDTSDFSSTQNAEEMVDALIARGYANAFKWRAGIEESS